LEIGRVGDKKTRQYGSDKLLRQGRQGRQGKKNQFFSPPLLLFSPCSTTACPNR